MKQALLVVLGLVLAATVAVTTAASGAWSHTADSCPVTIPTRVPPPGANFSAAGFNYGGRHLRAHLYWRDGILSAGVRPDGGAMATINRDGSIRVKIGWWRDLRGYLAITGRRLDASAPPMRASVDGGYGLRGFQPSGLTFPSVGCWRVVGRLQHVRLGWVVTVKRL